MAMTTNTNEKIENNTQEVANVQQVENQPAQEQKPEKKKIDWKGLGKKAAIGAGALAAGALAFGSGFLTGSKTSNSDSTQTAVPAGNDQPTEDSTF